MVRGDKSIAASSLPEAIANMEKEMIVDALKKCKGQQRKTAKELGITERILGYKIGKYGISPKYI